MTTSTSLQANSAEYYDPDADALPRNSPPMTSFKPGLDPDIDPEYESLDKPGSNPSKQSDIVLFDLLNCDRVKNRAQDPVNASDRSDLASADDEPSSPSCASPSSALSRSPAVAVMAGSESLQILAMGALAQSAKHQTNGDHQIPPILETSRHANSYDTRGRKSDHGFLPTRLAGRSSIHDIAPIQASQSIASPPRKIYSPIQTGTSPRDGSRDLASPVSPLLPASGLPPLQNIDSPRSDSSSQGPLPSIRQHFGNLALSPDNDGPSTRPPTLPHSPPASFPGISSMSTLAANRTSPPVSPSETYARRELPSPSQTLATAGYYYGQRNGTHRMSMEHHIAIESANGDHHPLASPGSMLVDRMSIDGLTNPAHQPPPPPGGFVCTFAGCNAMPFQTQYLLNSHANVHSSARPHYCHVQGCPRSEGGKGFKRKNEMIRHGLVHESPGYVCPFCPDREHKYPRPDNLQRHVRVHHLDKDKDDPLLREVLSQRPDGPNRGRRRRGNPA